jgi:hypothetical protein
MCLIPQSVLAQSTEAVSSISSILQQTGGWGLSAILMCVIWFLIRDNLKQRDARTRQMQEQYDALFNMMGKRIEADIKHEQAFKQLTKLIETLLTRV